MARFLGPTVRLGEESLLSCSCRRRHARCCQNGRNSSVSIPARLAVPTEPAIISRSAAHHCAAGSRGAASDRHVQLDACRGAWPLEAKAFAKFEFAPKVTCTQRGTRRAAAVHSEARNRSGAPCSSLHGRRTEGRLVSLVAVAALVCARKTAKSSASRMY